MVFTGDSPRGCPRGFPPAVVPAAPRLPEPPGLGSARSSPAGGCPVPFPLLFFPPQRVPSFPVERRVFQVYSWAGKAVFERVRHALAVALVKRSEEGTILKVLTLRGLSSRLYVK